MDGSSRASRWQPEDVTENQSSSRTGQSTRRRGSYLAPKLVRVLADGRGVQGLVVCKLGTDVWLGPLWIVHPFRDGHCRCAFVLVVVHAEAGDVDGKWMASGGGEIRTPLKSLSPPTWTKYDSVRAGRGHTLGRNDKLWNPTFPQRARASGFHMPDVDSYQRPDSSCKFVQPEPLHSSFLSSERDERGVFLSSVVHVISDWRCFSNLQPSVDPMTRASGY